MKHNLKPIFNIFVVVYDHKISSPPLRHEHVILTAQWFKVPEQTQAAEVGVGTN
jgi:hypothetical protein